MKSPSKFAPRSFLQYLRENNYISKSGQEYSKEEVDHLYWEKSTRLAELEAASQFNLYFKTY